MPVSSPSSKDSPTPYREPGDGPTEPPHELSEGGRDWRRATVLFALTVASVFGTSWYYGTARDAAAFTGALLAILVTHELGHFFAARIHKVAASPPFFIPMPVLSPFGTMGAIIRMSGKIPTRRALLDIGASGPLAGLVVAIPMYLWGASHSRFVPLGGEGLTLGESILLKTLDRVAAGPTPEGMTLELSPVAFAAWGGLFVTMINLLPVGQLDGGHVAYALLGTRQDRIAAFVHRSLLALFFVNLALFLLRDVRAGIGLSQVGRHLGSSMFWLVWFEVLAVLASLSHAREDDDEPRTVTNRQRLFGTLGLIGLASYGQSTKAEGLFWVAWFVGLALLLGMERKGGALRKTNMFDHPPTGAAPLDMTRKLIAIVTLVFFVLLFMPAPIVL